MKRHSTEFEIKTSKTRLNQCRPMETARYFNESSVNVDWLQSNLELTPSNKDVLLRRHVFFIIHVKSKQLR